MFFSSLPVAVSGHDNLDFSALLCWENRLYIGTYDSQILCVSVTHDPPDESTAARGEVVAKCRLGQQSNRKIEKLEIVRRRREVVALFFGSVFVLDALSLQARLSDSKCCIQCTLRQFSFQFAQNCLLSEESHSLVLADEMCSFSTRREPGRVCARWDLRGRLGDRPGRAARPAGLRQRRRERGCH